MKRAYAPVKRNRSVRGFTLVEVLICVGLLGILIVPFMSMVDNLFRSYHRSLGEVARRTELDAATYRLQSLMREHRGLAIGPKNHTLSWPGGGINWVDDKSQVVDTRGARTLRGDVTHFSVFRRDGLTFLSLEVRGKRSGKSHRRLLVVEEGGHAKGI